MQQTGDVCHQRGNLLTLCECLVQHLLVVHRFGLEIVLQCVVVIFHDFTQAFGKVRRIQQLAKAQTTARHLVFIGRSDTAPGGADGFFTPCTFTRLIEGNVIGKNQRTGLADFQARSRRHAGLVQHIEFFQQRRG